VTELEHAIDKSSEGVRHRGDGFYKAHRRFICGSAPLLITTAVPLAESTCRAFVQSYVRRLRWGSCNDPGNRTHKECADVRSFFLNTDESSVAHRSRVHGI